MFRIKNIEIDGFWGRFKVETEFNNDINIFLGNNGTGKTTLINFIEGVLNADIFILDSLEFNEINVLLTDSKHQRTINVKKNKNNLSNTEFIFTISREKYIIPCILDRNRFIRQRNRILTPRNSDEYNRLKLALHSLVSVSWLSVHRGLNILSSDMNIIDEDEFSFSSSVDQRLKFLSNEFIKYQLQLQKNEDAISKKFLNEIIISMLYDEKLDSIDIKEIINTDLSQEEENLTSAFKTLGVDSVGLQDKIKKHFEILNSCINKVKTETEKSEGARFRIADVLPFPLIQRTRFLIQSRKENLEKIKKVYTGIELFLNEIKDFFKNKKFALNRNGNIEVKVANDKISIYQLSSGEKQLLIILLEALLHQNKTCLFIADEPEISLHVEWQEKLLDSIKKLNKNVQLIIATHSPEIVADYSKKVFHMENIVDVK